MASTPAEEVQSSLEVAWEMAEKVARGFFKEEWVDEPGTTILLEDLAVVLVPMDGEAEWEVVEVILGDVAETMSTIHVGEEVDLTTLEKISKMNAVTIQLDMVG